MFSTVLLIFFELMVVTAIAILFSSFSTPVLSGMFTLGIYVIGHMTADLKLFGAKSGSGIAKAVTEILYYVLPNLENFNIKGKVVHEIPVGWEYISLSMAYGVMYILGILFLSMVILQRRDFK